MSIAALPRISGVLVIAAVALGAVAVSAQPVPDADNGRYALSPIADGVLRLDTRTGAVSACTNSGTGWACYEVPDERAAMDTEIGRLQAANEKLKAQLAERDQPPGKIDEPKIDEPLPKTDSLKPPAGPNLAEGERKIEIPRIEIPLPSDRDMDRMMSAVEQAWRRLVDIANRVQKDVSGRI